MRRLIFVLLFLLALPAQAVTRIYFGSTRNADFFETFAADAGWEDTAGLRRGPMHIAGSRGHRGRGWPRASNSVTLTPSSSNQAVHTQFQMRLAVGTSFTSGVDGVTMQGFMGEGGSTHDVNQCILGLRVIAEDGTVRATLLPVANYGTTTELVVLFTFRNKICANGDTVQASYTSVDGDYLVLEVGYQNDGATGASSTAQHSMGDGSGWNENAGTETDCAAGDETDTSCIAWIEFSNNFSSPGDTGPETRFWLPSTGAADVSPTSSAWTVNDEVEYFEMVLTQGSTASGAGQTVDMLATPIRSNEVDRVYVSNPLAAGIAFTQGRTTVTGAMAMQELATTDEIFGAAIVVKVVSQDGTTLRADLLSTPLFVGFTESSAVAARNTPLSRGTAVINSYTTVAGDRLVVEIGYSIWDTAPTTPQARGTYGEDVGVDCDETVWTGAACDPWIEFSNSITEQGNARRPILSFLLSSPTALVSALIDFFWSGNAY